MNNRNKIIMAFFLLVFWSCNELQPQSGYCELAFAYPIDQELPDVIYKDRIGCACTTKDIIKGMTIKSWELRPLEECRRVRGFHPTIWAETIDPWFKEQYEMAHYDGSKRSKRRLIRKIIKMNSGN